jgi:aminoglycoside phosphotransferase (APT) family kinase protein
VQPEVAGRAELNDLGFDLEIGLGARERWLRMAGSCLAGLHGVVGIAGPPRTLADDLEELEEYIAPMEIVNAELAGRYTAAIAAIRDLAGAHAELAPVASHGAFRTDQFMIDGDGLVMIDLDGFCWASPARDIGNYLAYLGWKRIRQPQRAELIDRAGQLLREGYRALRELPDARWLAIYEAASMLKIAGRRFRSLTTKEWHLIPALLDAADRAISE